MRLYCIYILKKIKYCIGTWQPKVKFSQEKHENPVLMDGHLFNSVSDNHARLIHSFFGR